MKTILFIAVFASLLPAFHASAACETATNFREQMEARESNSIYSDSALAALNATWLCTEALLAGKLGTAQRLRVYNGTVGDRDTQTKNVQAWMQDLDNGQNFYCRGLIVDEGFGQTIKCEPIQD